MKKNMLIAIIFITLFSCTDIVEELNDTGIDQGLINGSISIPTESFIGEYFNSFESKNPISIRVEENIDHNFNNVEKTGLIVEELGAIWTGKFDFAAGEYNFSIKSDKGIKVIIDDKVVLEEIENQKENVYEIDQSLEGVHRLIVKYNVSQNATSSFENVSNNGEGSIDSSSVDIQNPVVEANSETPTVEVNWTKKEEVVDNDPPSNEGGGMLYTSEQLAMWRDRAKNGPFKTSGDAFTNSPNDWEHMLEDARIFGSKDYVIWQGPDGTGLVTKDWKAYYESDTWSNYRPTRLMIAAFVDLVRGTNEYTAKIKKALLAQAKVPRLDFTNTNIYQNGHLSDQIFGWADWQTKLIHAYDYVGKDAFTPSEQKLLEDWFEAGALWHSREIDANLGQMFANTRDGNVDNYKVKSLYNELRPNEYFLWDGGPTMGYVNPPYNNRRTAQAKFVAYAGVVTGNQKLIDQASKYVKEYLAYFWWGNGTFSEMERNNSSTPANGMFYGGNTMGPISEISYVLYKNGYENLFEFSTQAGGAGSASPGINKSIEWSILEYIKYINGTYSNRKWNGHSLNPYKYGSIEWMQAASIANLYYENQAIQNAMEKYYPANPKSNGPYPIYYFVAGSGPAYMFMYAK